MMLTPIAAGAIAVVQVAGPEALAIAEAVFRPASGRRLSQYAAGRMAYGQFLDAGATVVDDGLAVWGGSFRQSWVQFSLHGGVRIVQRVIQRAVALGAELHAGEASPDEVSRPDQDRAFDWLCPLERAIQTCLAQAATPRVVEWLIRQGSLWRGLLADWRRRLQAAQDASVLAEAQSLLDRPDLQDAWRGQTLAILGLPNVGKSTIANRLAGRAVSLVADLPGTTRDWVGQPIGLLGWPVWMVDTAGLRPSTDPVQAASMALALEQARRADLRLLVIDSTCAPSDSECLLAARAGLRSCDVVAWTKCDLAEARPANARRIDVPPGVRRVHVSGLTGAGWSGLERALAEGFGFSALQEPKPLVFCAEVQMGVAHVVSALKVRKPARALAAAERLTAADVGFGQ